MPLESQVSHRNVRNTALPYKSNVSPTDTDPKYVTGSQDLMTSINGYAERRPGFADNVETTPTTFNSLQRLFTWDRNDGTFYVMACDVNASNQAVVYKYQVGADLSFSSIYTDTLSSTPFDFVTSNNTLYFSNGNVAKKWDPINGVSNWGISIGSMNSAPSGPNAVATGANVTTLGNPWTSPGSVTVQDGVFATRTSTGAGSDTQSDYLEGTNCSFTVPAGNTITGFLVEVKGKQTSVPNNNTGIFVRMVKGGNPIGNQKFIQLSTSNAFVSLGGSADTWGATFTPNDANASTFGALLFAQNTSGTSITFSIDFIRITVYSLGAPTVTFTGTGLTATNGYQYVVCFGNSNTGHISSPTPPSNVVKPANQSMVVPLTHSTDAQVNQIRVFRSTDVVTAGTNASIYFEIPTSPFANSDANITDGAADTALIVSSIAPTSGFNDPPPPGRGPVYYAGRLWLFKGHQVFYSSLEECVQGVPEESFVSGLGGNFWNYDEPVQALAVGGTLDSQIQATFCGGRLYAITGSSLDTFRRFLVTTRRGCRNLATTTMMGGMMAWLDSANQIWVSNGSSLQEISQDIRPDISGVTPSACSMTFHAEGRFHWLVFSTGSKLFVYDLDLEQWMPPWSLACNYIYSGEVAPGSYKLMACLPTKAVMLSTTAHNDNGASYQPIAKTNLFPMVPDFGNRFSFMAMGMYDEPSRTGAPLYFQVDTNGVALSDVAYLADDDPLNAGSTYTSIFSRSTTPATAFNRNNGTNLVQNVYGMVGTIGPACRWVSWKITGANADDGLKIYDFFTAYKGVGGR